MSQYVTGAGVAQNKGGKWGLGYRLNPPSKIHKKPPVLDEANVLCNLVGNLKAYQLAVTQVNTETQAKDLAVDVVIDGEAIPTFTFSAENANTYLIALSVANFGSGGELSRTISATLISAAPSLLLLGTQPLECGSLKVTITLKTAAGTNQLLDSWLETAVH